MTNYSFIYVLILLIQTCRVTTVCSSYPSLRCCPDSIWDDEQNKCVGCPAGYLGPNCTIPCNPPQYGKECQFTCTCKGYETCHPSNGCVSPPPPTTTTEITTTIKDDIGTTEADVGATSGASSTTKTTNGDVGVTLLSSTGNQKFDLQNDTDNIKDFMVMGIFVLCGLFILLFATFVGVQIRHKCFNKNMSTIQSTAGVQLNSYDVINADQPPEVDDLSQTEEAIAQDRTLPKYVEIVGSPKNSTGDHGDEFSTMSERTYSKQLYLSAV